MSVTLINGDGTPRVLASQDADWYGALTGEKTCIIPINDSLSATVTDSNTVEIGSGVCVTKEGRRVQIDEGDIEEIIIPTGTQGEDTYYIIGFHLYINELGQQVAETFVETMASATDTITETTFKEGSSSIYVSLYRVKRSGLLMDSITRIIPILKTIVDINDILGSTDISAIGDGTVTGIIPTLNSDLTIKQNKIDNSLATTSKTVTGAINEVNSSLTNLSSQAARKNVNNVFTTSQTIGSTSLANLSLHWIDPRRHVWAGTANSNGSYYIWDTTNNKAILSSDASGNNAFNGNITGFANGISTFIDDSSTASLASGDGGILTARYPTGSLFFVMVKVAFAANTSGTRSVGITTSNGSRLLQKVSACSSGKTILTASDIVGYTSNGIGLWVAQNSGSTLSIEYEFKIIRIR